MTHVLRTNSAISFAFALPFTNYTRAHAAGILTLGVLPEAMMVPLSLIVCSCNIIKPPQGGWARGVGGWGGGWGGTLAGQVIGYGGVAVPPYAYACLRACLQGNIR
jgi:hypothetical protein